MLDNFSRLLYPMCRIDLKTVEIAGVSPGDDETGIGDK
jgi:hypothetical protein